MQKYWKLRMQTIVTVMIVIKLHHETSDESHAVTILFVYSALSGLVKTVHSVMSTAQTSSTKESKLPCCTCRFFSSTTTLGLWASCWHRSAFLSTEYFHARFTFIVTTKECGSWNVEENVQGVKNLVCMVPAVAQLGAIALPLVLSSKGKKINRNIGEKWHLHLIDKHPQERKFWCDTGNHNCPFTFILKYKHRNAQRVCRWSNTFLFSTISGIPSIKTSSTGLARSVSSGYSPLRNTSSGLTSPPSE